MDFSWGRIAMISSLVGSSMLSAQMCWAELYVVSDGARLRSRPSSKAKVVARLKFGESVKDLGKRSKKPTKSRVGCEEKRARWWKIKTPKGISGWLWRPLLAKSAPKPSIEDWRAVIAFRGEAETGYDAWKDLISKAKTHCSGAGLHFNVVDRKKPCTTIEDGRSPKSTIDLTNSLSKQGHGWILKARGEQATYLSFEAKNLSKVAQFCKSGTKALAPPLPAPKKSRLLLNLTPSAWTCAWNVYNLEAGLVRTIHSTEKCPKTIIWAKNKVLYTIDDVIYEQAWPPKGAGEARPNPKVEDPSVAWQSPWLDADSGRLRMGYTVPAKVTKKGKKKTFEHSGRSFETTVDDRNWTHVLVKGKKFELPPWGLESIAVVLEWSGKGGEGWKEIVAAPTVCDAGEVPCMGLLSDWQKTSKRAISTQKSRVYCASGHVDCYAPDALTKKKALWKALGASEEDNDGLGYLKAGDRGYLFKIVFGDSPHGVGPVFECKKNCEKRTKIYSNTSDSVAIVPSGDFVLIAREYSNEQPKIYKAGRKKPVLSLSGWADWLKPSPVLGGL